MRQILQSLKTGQTELVQVPAPKVRSGSLRIETTASLVSAGTERMLVEFGKANWFEKARQQPDKVRMVLDKARTDGIAATIETVQSKLDQPLALGYCNVGVVAELGANATGFDVGDRVVSNGHHAEMVVVPRNLCARIPDGVTDEEASFTVLTAVGLQGVRLANPTLGECVAVIGLGLIGLLTVQILKAQGCRVLGLDLDPSRLALAKSFGAEVVDVASGQDPLAIAAAFSRGRGVDAVLITASTSSNEPVRQAANMCRKRGRIVLVGVTGLELSRADFFEKELTFQVSCSYGPGRYDPAYEDGGHDYPVGYVRWTEQRNFEAVLDLMAAGALDVRALVSHRFALNDALEAYSLLSSGRPSLGIVLTYPGARPTDAVVRRVETLAAPLDTTGVAVSFLGAGNYATRALMPAFKSAGARLHAVTSAQGVSAVHFGRKHGFALASSDEADTSADPATDAIVIATRHSAHARQVLAALDSNKHVFCEKPLCLTLDELHAIEAAHSRSDRMVMVGFNRRFAPHVQKMKTLLEGVSGPKSLIMTVNAGAIPMDHWTQDKAVGGGRIIGEACHFIDLMRYLAGAPITERHALALGRHPSLETTDDKVVLTLGFGDGSVGTIHYLANGHKAVAKERLEVFCAGRILQLSNFRSLQGFGWPGFSKMSLWSQDKGQAACVAAFVEALKAGGPSPIPFDEVLEVSRVSIELAAALEA